MTRDQVEADWLLEHGRTPDEVARMQAAQKALTDAESFLNAALRKSNCWI